MVRQDQRIRTRTHTPTHIQTYTETKTTSKGENGQKNKKKKKLLASIMVKQDNKHCVVKRGHINSEKESRL